MNNNTIYKVSYEYNAFMDGVLSSSKDYYSKIDDAVAHFKEIINSVKLDYTEYYRIEDLEGDDDYYFTLSPNEWDTIYVVITEIKVK